MSRNAPAIALAVLAALLLVAGALLFRAYQAADAERVALAEQVRVLQAEVSAARQRVSQLESQIATLTEEAARLHEQNQRLLEPGATREKGS